MQYVNEYLNCFCYNSTEQPAVELKKVEKNTPVELYTTRYKLFFLIEGKIQIEAGIKDRTEIKKGVFWFVAVGQTVRIRAVSNALMLIMRINSRIALCDCYSIEQLYKSFKDKANEPMIHERRLYTGLICPSLWHCIKSLYNITTDGLRCPYILEIKEKEVMFLLRAYYTKQELYRIFHHALTGDLVFSEHIKKTWHKYRTVDELAQAMHYTSSGFYKRFMAVFNTSPREWIRKQKEAAVYSDLISSELSIKNIATKWGFSSIQSFSNYCHKLYRESPGQIRNIRKEGRNDETID
jgi:AraC-like DNA-binding protein